MSEKNYVYNGTEVEKTGRVAKRESTGTRRRTAPELLFEITPVDKEEGSWKKWVQSKELYEIVNNTSEENEENNND